METLSASVALSLTDFNLINESETELSDDLTIVPLRCFSNAVPFVNRASYLYEIVWNSSRIIVTLF